MYCAVNAIGALGGLIVALGAILTVPVLLSIWLNPPLKGTQVRAFSIRLSVAVTLLVAPLAYLYFAFARHHGGC